MFLISEQRLCLKFANFIFKSDLKSILYLDEADRVVLLSVGEAAGLSGLGG